MNPHIDQNVQNAQDTVEALKGRIAAGDATAAAELPAAQIKLGDLLAEQSRVNDAKAAADALQAEAKAAHTAEQDALLEELATAQGVLKAATTAAKAAHKEAADLIPAYRTARREEEAALRAVMTIVEKLDEPARGDDGNIIDITQPHITSTGNLILDGELVEGRQPRPLDFVR
ncbi:hypothetical protein [Corynebacterium flavescens]|uniref:hypothetical protein n=1 Tax=Corynebacterium flavescens TaxID=28028 RepID=UPI003FD36397